MIEVIVYTFLKNELEDVPVYMEISEKVPDSFVLIEKTGSGLNNHIKSATFAIQSYGPTMFKAAELNELVKEKMLDIIGEKEITKVSLNSDYNFTDTTTKHYRYQAVFDLKHY